MQVYVGNGMKKQLNYKQYKDSTNIANELICFYANENCSFFIFNRNRNAITTRNLLVYLLRFGNTNHWSRRTHFSVGLDVFNNINFQGSTSFVIPSSVSNGQQFHSIRLEIRKLSFQTFEYLQHRTDHSHLPNILALYR